MLVTKEVEVEGDNVPVFHLKCPVTPKVPFLFNSPHSGAHYPAHFLKLSRLGALALRKTEDAFVNELFGNVVSYGAVFLQAMFPRSFIDLNREPYELDKSMLVGSLPDYANTKSVRVRNGLGTVARLVSEYEAIYKARLPVETVLRRIELIYKPYHEMLGQQLDEIYENWGMSVLVDCHSMPSITPPGRINRQADIVIGDRYGSSCENHMTNHMKDSLVRKGYNVTLNKPYAGGFITKNYGRPEQGRHAIQIEINRGIYMDESRIEKISNFSVLKRDLDGAMQEVMQRVTEENIADKVAAE